ncbi:MAG TPA: hypothetical protein PK733_16180, partial [Clostridiales bacterium]|nr:hypothetical protein [Clostridiales bacterium]
KLSLCHYISQIVDTIEEDLYGGAGIMKKRIIAWVMLSGFVLLLVNILIIGYQRILSVLVYLVIAFYYILFMNKKSRV